MMFRSVMFSLEWKLWVGIVLIVVFRSAHLTGVAALGTYRAVVLISSVSPRECGRSGYVLGQSGCSVLFASLLPGLAHLIMIMEICIAR